MFLERYDLGSFFDHCPIWVHVPPKDCLYLSKLPYRPT